MEHDCLRLHAFLKKVLNYQLSNSSPKMSNSTCCTRLNPNILLCSRAKQAKKFQIIVVIPRKILMYFCVGEQSKLENSSCFIKSNPKLVFISEQSEPKIF